MDSRKRIFGLDVLRCTAILMVLLNHSVQLLKPMVSPSTPGKVFGSFLACFQPLGMLGVELFFVLSGYLIGSILIEEFVQERCSTSERIWHFWKRRWFRTLPNYYLVLIFIMIVSSTFNWKYILFFQNFQIGQLEVFPESWSLAVEELFYLALPLLVQLFIFVFPGSKKRGIANCIIALIAISFSLKIAVYYHYSFDLSIYKELRTTTYLRLDAIAVGVLFAYLNRFYPRFFDKKIRLLFVLGFVSTFMLVLVYYLQVHPNLNWYNENVLLKRLVDLFFYPFLSISLALTLPLLSKFSIAKENIISRSIVHISRTSYSLYLVHGTILLGLVFKPIQQAYSVPSFILFLSYLITCFIISSIQYRYFELPAMNLRERF